MCMSTHTHTRTWGTWREPRGRDETPGGPEESRWTESRHICIRIYKVHTCIYMLGGEMRSWTYCVFSPEHSFSSKKANQKMWTNSQNSKLRIFAIKGTKLFLLKIINTIIITLTEILPMGLFSLSASGMQTLLDVVRSNKSNINQEFTTWVA